MAVSIRAAILLLLSLVSVLVQGYHLGTDDGEIYVPAIKQAIQPDLYPVEPQFFLMHGRLSYLAPTIAFVSRTFHLAPDKAISGVYFAGVFLLLVAGWRIADILFLRERSVWCAVGVLALLVSVPVAGTALPIADPYLTARTLSTPLSLLALASFLRDQRWSVLFYLLLTGLVHPQMVVYTVGFLAFLLLPGLLPVRVRAALLVPSLWDSFSLRPARGTYHDVLYTRTFFFLTQWRWWEWVGAAVPLSMLYFFSRVPLRSAAPALPRIARALVWFGIVSTAVELVFSLSTRFDSLQRLQPMRSFHLIYILFFLICGGLLAEYVLQKHVWRWVLLFVPLAAGMWALNRSLYPASPHLELPGRAPGNPWIASFLWVRAHTPVEALFALNPRYMELPGEDRHGFRAIAERSRLADYDKDSGAVTMFPQLLPAWERDQKALAGWGRFALADFQKLRRETGVTWVVLERPVPGLPCPYTNQAVRVCRIPEP